MTDTTDITALREHNQHIVAHLTRSNPRRPLSSAEVLTLESAKLVVAALSVRDGLPDADHSEYWFEHEGKLLFDGALFNSRVEIFIESKLEAERQRADENQAGSNTFKAIIGYIKNPQRNDTFGLWKETSDRLNADGCNGTANHVIEYLEELNKVFESEAELAALKGEQVPVAVIQFSKHRKLPDGSKPDWNEMPKVVSCNWLPDGTYNVYLHPQVPVNLENVGYVQVDEGTFYLDESGMHAAIGAAGGIVKDGE